MKVLRKHNSGDPSPPESKGSSVSPKVVKCAGGSGLSKYFMKKESEMDDNGDSIPCS